MTHDSFKTRLLARRKELLGDLSDIETQLDATPSKDWEDRASERQGDEVLEALGQAELDELRQIDAALARFKEGTYGECARCGDDIPHERLDIIPATPFCSNCAANH